MLSKSERILLYLLANQSQFQACIELGDKKCYWSFVLCGIHFTAVLCHPGSTKDSWNDFAGAPKCLKGHQDV